MTWHTVNIWAIFYKSYFMFQVLIVLCN
jgi:hypothetical protein